MSLQRYFWDFLERCLKSLSMHVKSKWQFKNGSLEKSRKSFGISDHMSQEKIAFSLYSNPLKTTMLYTEAKLFFASLRAAGGGMSTNFLPFNARSGLSISFQKSLRWRNSKCTCQRTWKGTGNAFCTYLKHFGNAWNLNLTELREGASFSCCVDLVPGKNWEICWRWQM